MSTEQIKSLWVIERERLGLIRSKRNAAEEMYDALVQLLEIADMNCVISPETCHRFELVLKKARGE